MKIPKPRKIKHKTHKCFGNHSRIIDEYAEPGTTGGRHIGDKQILPGEYGRRQTGGYNDRRSKAELMNDAEINHTEDDDELNRFDENGYLFTNPNETGN